MHEVTPKTHVVRRGVYRREAAPPRAGVNVEIDANAWIPE